MSEPLRAHEPEDPSPSGAASAAADDPSLAELIQRAREQAEAEAAVAAVMRREDEKTARREAMEHRHERPAPLKAMLLAVLMLFSAYLWFANPQWLTYHEPSAPSLDYYEGSWRIAVYLQRQRIEEYRRVKGAIPAAAQQAGPPVHGVQYTPLDRTRTYQLAAGSGGRQFVYRSTDSLSILMGRTLIQMGLVEGGVR